LVECVCAGEEVDVFDEEVEWRLDGKGFALKVRDAEVGARIQSPARKTCRRLVYAASGTGASIRAGDLTLYRRFKVG
jgi:hypothetical protein